MQIKIGILGARGGMYIPIIGFILRNYLQARSALSRVRRETVSQPADETLKLFNLSFNRVWHFMFIVLHFQKSPKNRQTLYPIKKPVKRPAFKYVF